jgi:hypothetical protein
MPLSTLCSAFILRQQVPKTRSNLKALPILCRELARDASGPTASGQEKLLFTLEPGGNPFL